MRLLRVYIDAYRNLKNVTVDFDKDSLTTVVIGENGTGKSNLIEAIVEVFRAYDLNQNRLSAFRFEIDYQINGLVIKLHNTHKPDGQLMCSVVREGAASYGIGSTAKPHLPDMIFGYYSGTGRKLERLFDAHQSRYYDVINKDRPRVEYQIARENRRLFYCRSAHGALALLSYLAKPRGDDGPGELLTESLGITGFHSALALLKQPSWFKEGQRAAMRETSNIWGAHGPAGDCARLLRDSAFHALELDGTYVDDYRRAASKEAQLACFLRDERALREFAANYKTDKEMFAALEAADISDLFREVTVWVTRKNDVSGDISFSDLSDGERQLLMVLGLIRMARGKEVLFLLDEPDTHLNPAWQLTYLELIREWTEVAADEETCQIVMTTHNPLTIAALTRKEVRVMQTVDDGQIKVSEPYADPRGLGFTSTLTEIFGLPTTLDPETQKQIDERNTLARIEQRSEKQEKMLIQLNDKLDRLGFLHESRDPLYDDFLKAVQDYKYADRPPMTQDQIEKRRLAMQALIKSLSEQGERPH
tara:strand:- start:869 stop:2470 length:1602 start_codon:yes stop_codon:yes gene_type:complete